jgi:hypothetical protein
MSMHKAIITVLIVVTLIATAILVVRSRSAKSPQTYGDLRQQFFDQAGRSSSHRSSPPSRPANLDTRLPAAIAAQLRRLYPPTKDTSKALHKCYEEVEGSIFKELEAIDPNTDWYELLSPGRRALVLIESLEGEVDNGGFDQYYLNSSGDGASLAPAALRMFGQEKVALMVERGNAQFPGGPPADRNQRLIQMKSLGEQAQKVWGDLDNEFYKLDFSNGLGIDAAIPYILAHESEFFLPH